MTQYTLNGEIVEDLPKNSTELASFILEAFPETRNSSQTFKRRAFEWITLQAKNRTHCVELLMKYDVVGMVRRRGERIYGR